VEQDHDHSLEIFKKPEPLDEFAPLGRYFQKGNTNANKFYNTPLHHTYLPRRPVKREPVPEVTEWANWARNVR